MFQCKRCSVQIFESNAEKEFGDLIIRCLICGAKNILAPKTFNNVPVYGFLQVIAWRD